MVANKGAAAVLLLLAGAAQGFFLAPAARPLSLKAAPMQRRGPAAVVPTVLAAAGPGTEDPRIKDTPKFRERPRQYTGKAFVTKDNIDTDQIIPAEYLTLVPSKIDEYEQLGSYALIGLPDQLYPTRYVEPGKMKTEYPIIIGGDNFGCGSSREHAPIALGAAGARVIIAQSYARIFFRNCIATGECYPYECPDIRLCDEVQTGHEVVVDMDRDVLVNKSTGKEYKLQPLGDAGPVIDAGGIFPFAVKEGFVKLDK